jgi:hypothetical protein
MTIDKPGMNVSVDQLESPVSGFIAEMNGRLTRQRYKAATIFVDHFSSLSYVHLQQSTLALETLQAKMAFETYAASCGVLIHKYHADNGRFAETAWRDDITSKSQSLSFSGVGAHHQTARQRREYETYRI